MEDVNLNLDSIHNIQLEILLEFDRVCKRNDIKYQLFAGTLLGAIRHKGFIPWDDDVDVCLLRKDYDRFIEICKSDLDFKYFLQTYETDKKYQLQFAKLRKNNTLFVEKGTSKCDIHHGIYIDIFPMDNVLPNTIVGKIQQKLLYIVSRINLSRIWIHCIEAKNPTEKYISFVLHYVLKIIPKRCTDILQNKIACMFNNKDVKYISHLTNGASYERYKKYMMEEDKFNFTIDGIFEDHIFPIPKAFDEILTNIYGDYMSFPPIEKRKPHHGIVKVKYR